MRRCKKCPTILRTGNKTEYCSICEPASRQGGGSVTPQDPYRGGGQQQQWDRMIFKIRTEVARCCGITVIELEKSRHDPYKEQQLIVHRIIAELFCIPASAVVRFGRIPRDIVAHMRNAGETLYTRSGEFRAQYDKTRTAVQSIGHDILPACAETRNLHPPQGIHEQPAVIRMTRTTRAPRQLPRSVAV